MKSQQRHRILMLLIAMFCGFMAYGVPSTRYEGISTNNHLHLGLEWQSMKGLSGYYNNARFRDALLAGMFYQQDPLAEKYYPFSPYHYGAGNPIKFTDKTGKFLETVWDVISFSTGVVSLYNNIVSGNYGDAVADGVGVLVDAAAVLIPGVPGGAGAAIKAGRTAENLADITTVTRVDSKVIETNNSKNIRFISDTDGKIIDTQSTPKGTYIQPNGDRTDILQNKNHYKKVENGQFENHGTTHTHKAKQNIDKNGVVHKYVDRNDTHLPTIEEIINIQTGKAIRK